MILADFKIGSRVLFGLLDNSSSCVNGWNMPIERDLFFFFERAPLTTKDCRPERSV
jgi:hypothetical protein